MSEICFKMLQQRKKGIDKASVAKSCVESERWVYRSSLHCCLRLHMFEVSIIKKSLLAGKH